MSILHFSIMVNNSHNAPIDVSDIIKQLVSRYKGKVEKLLPIRGISKEFELGKNIQKFKFKPPKEYKKEGYEVEVHLGDDEKRVEEFTKLNNDIREYNKWLIEKNKKLSKQLIKKAPANKDGVTTGDVKDLGIHSSYSIFPEYDMWQIPVIIEDPQDENREFDPYDKYLTIYNQQLHNFARELPEDDFVKRFNKTIFDCLLKERQEAKKLDIWDSEHTWWHPVREFSMWFSINNLNHKDIESFILIKRKNRGGRKSGKSTKRSQKEDIIRKLYVLYKSGDRGDQTKRDAARSIRGSLLKSKPKEWKGDVYQESTIYKVLKTLK